MGLTYEQRIFIVEHYFAIKCFVLCQEALPNDAVPNKTTIHRLIRKSFETDRVCGTVVYSDDTLKDIRPSFLHFTIRTNVATIARF